MLDDSLKPKANVLYDYDGQVTGDLTMRRGETVVILEREGAEGWWYGTIGSRAVSFILICCFTLNCCV